MLLSDHILFLDGEALVVDKPEGLPVDPPRDGSLSLENHLDSLRFGFKRWPLAVHRLDRDTSGCLLLARNPKAHGRFTRAFEGREVEKQYLAIIDGVPDGDGGTIDLPLAKTSTAETGWRMVVDPNGKPSVSHWESLPSSTGGRCCVSVPKPAAPISFASMRSMGWVCRSLAIPCTATAAARTAPCSTPSGWW